MAPGFTPQDITDLALKIYDSTVISKIPLLGSAIDLAEDYWKKGRDIPRVCLHYKNNAIKAIYTPPW